MPRIFPGLPADHFAVTTPELCYLCEQPFKAGDETTLIAIAPADDEEREKMKAGRAYNAEAKLIHARCYFAAERVAQTITKGHT